MTVFLLSRQITQQPSCWLALGTQHIHTGPASQSQPWHVTCWEVTTRRCMVRVLEGISHLLRSVSMPGVDLEASLRALVDGSYPPP